MAGEAKDGIKAIKNACQVEPKKAVVFDVSNMQDGVRAAEGLRKVSCSGSCCGTMSLFTNSAFGNSPPYRV